MVALPQRKMSVDEYLAWAESQADGRYELVRGEVFAMSPQRVAHARIKHRIARALEDAVRDAGLDCEMLPDGVSVPIDDATVYEPDALLRCGGAVSGDAVSVADPIVVVEVVSPSSARRDAGAKLADYFRLPSVQHYLIVRPDDEVVIHHRRDAAVGIQTSILRGGRLDLDPPGVSCDIAAFFA